MNSARRCLTVLLNVLMAVLLFGVVNTTYALALIPVEEIAALEWWTSLRRGHVPQALASAVQAAEANEAHATARYGFALQANNQHREAVEAFQSAIDDDSPYRAQLEQAKAESLYLLGNRDEARSTWQRVFETFATSRSALDLAAAGHAAAELGRWSYGRFSEALTLFQTASQIDASNPYYTLASARLLLDKYNSAEAVDELTPLLAEAQPDLEALVLLARIQQFDNNRAAEQTVEQVLSIDPDRVDGRLIRARARLEAEDYPAARSDLEAALAVHPRSREALELLAALDFLVGSGDVFEEAVLKVRAMVPGSSRLFLELGRTAARNRRYDEAVQFSLGAVSVDRQDWEAHVVLGVNRMRQGDIAAGRAALNTAFQGDPFNIWAKNTLDLLDKVETFGEHRSPHFLLSAPYDEAPVLAPYLLPIAEAAYATFAERYGHRPRRTIRIEVYASHEDFSVRTAGVVGLGILGVSFGPVIALDSPSAGAFGPLNWASVVWHEVAHSFHLSLSGHRTPRWFSEGLAVYEERDARVGWGADVSPSFLRAFSAGELPPPSKLNDLFLNPESQEQIVHGYFLGSLLVEFIVSRNGFDVIVDLLEGFRERKVLSELVPEVLGLSEAELDEKFDAYLRQRYAKALMAVTPTDDAPKGPYAKQIEAGVQAAKSKDFDEAERIFKQAQKMFPEHGGPGSSYDLLSRLFEEQEQWNTAASWLLRSVNIDADDLAGHKRLASLYGRLERPEEQREILSRVVLIDPFDTEIHLQLAELNEQREAWEDAVVSRRALASLSPRDPVVSRERLARAQMMSGDFSGARQSLLRALEQAPMHESGLELLMELRSKSAKAQ